MVQNVHYEKCLQDQKGFDKLAKYLKDQTGINLNSNEKNKSLLASRIHPLLLKMGDCSYEDFLKKIISGDSDLKKIFIESMTTNKTEFNREYSHFQFINKEIKKLLDNKRGQFDSTFRIWCAAASTGEEPYTILFHYLDAAEKSLCKLKFLASDIDTKVLEKASVGIYNTTAIKPLSSAHKSKYLEIKDSHHLARVKKNYRDMITFAKFNLNNAVYDFEYKFDLIFLRNVLIYFEPKLVDQVIYNMYKSLAPGGHLIVGLSETAFKPPHGLVSVDTGIYRKEA